MTTTDHTAITDLSHKVPEFFQNHLRHCESLPPLCTYDLGYSGIEGNMYSLVAGFEDPNTNSCKYFTYHQLSMKNRIALTRNADAIHEIDLTPYPMSKISRVTLYVCSPETGEYIPVKSIENPPTRFSFYNHPLYFSRMFTMSIGVDFSSRRIMNQNIGIQRYMLTDNIRDKCIM